MPIKYIGYDNDANNGNLSTPSNELVNPAGSTNIAANVVHKAGYKFAMAPSRAILVIEYQEIDWTQVDMLILQLQGITSQPSVFENTTTQISTYVKRHNPNALVFVHVNPVLDTISNIVNDVNSTRNSIDGVSIMCNTSQGCTATMLDELITQLNGLTNQVPPPSNSSYPVHQNISTTYFWVGEGSSPDNRYISNAASAWDDQWLAHYGCVDNPNNRNGYYPAACIPKENPFYFALPYNDFANGNRKANANNLVYWLHEKTWGPLQSMLKNQWIEITKGTKTVYAQWEDVGPFGEDDSAYVFGGATPSNPYNSHAGLDVSPAVNHFLGLNGLDTTSWKFVDASDVPDGPWKQIITTSQIYWGP